jgi:hypothetical protein
MKRVTSLFSLLLLITTLAGPFSAHAQEEFCGGPNTSFKEGERVTYKVYYNVGMIWASAGEAVFTTSKENFNGRAVYHVVGDGRTFKNYDWVFKVRDRYETFIDAETLLPLRFTRNVSEGNIKFKNLVDFNHRTGQATSTGGVFAISKCVQDVLSAIYYARNLDYGKYKPGTQIPFKMFLDDKVYNLSIKYLGREKTETRWGTFNAFKISPSLIAGTIFKGGDEMIVWMGDDPNHLPVRIQSPIIVGSVKVDLVDVTGLRAPLNSLIRRNRE